MQNPLGGWRRRRRRRGGGNLCPPPPPGAGWAGRISFSPRPTVQTFARPSLSLSLSQCVRVCDGDAVVVVVVLNRTKCRIKPDGPPTAALVPTRTHTFHWVGLLLGFFLGFIGFYWVLLGFTGFYWVLLGFTGFYLVLPSFTGFYWVLPSFT